METTEENIDRGSIRTRCEDQKVGTDTDQSNEKEEVDSEQGAGKSMIRTIARIDEECVRRSDETIRI